MAGNRKKSEQKEESDGPFGPSNICRDCKQACKDGQKALCCNLCNRWYHARCQRMSDTKYDLITQDSEDQDGASIQWYCKPSCNKVADKFMGIFMTMQTQIDNIGRDVTETKDRVEKIEVGEFTEPMVKTIRNITSKSGAAAATIVDKEEIKKMIDISSKEKLAEVEDRAKRSRNVIIFGIEEPQSLDREDRAKEDTTKCITLIEELQCEHEPQEVRRLGNFKPDQSKPRPIRLRFATKEQRDGVLENFREAKRKDSGKKLDPTLGMRRDMTPMERKEDFELFNVIKEKREASKASGDGYARWVKRNGKVVNVGQYPGGQPST